MKRIAISRLPELLEQLAAQAAVYCPLVTAAGTVGFPGGSRDASRC